MKTRFARASLILPTFVLATSVQASNHYALDDGAPNAGLSYGIPADYGWMQWFDTIGAQDAISKVSIMWQAGGVLPGTPLHVCVWEDPNDDGNPYDAQLIAQVDSLVPNVANATYVDYPVFSPAVVHGRFFIGAYLTTGGSDPAIALLDYDAPYTLRAWFAVNGPGGFDAQNLGNNAPDHIETLGAGIHGVFTLRAEGTGAVPVTYCTAKTNALGCEPQIGYLGFPSVSAGSGFFLLATNELNRTTGLLMYGTSGQASTPFSGGTLCVATPLRRTAAQVSGGSASGSDCTGIYVFDFAAWIATGVDPALVTGATVDCQYYSRDPGFVPPDNVALTKGLEFVLAP